MHTYANTIIDIEPTIGYVTFVRPDNVIVFIAPSTRRNCYEFSYSNYPNSNPVIMHSHVLAPFFAANPHIAAALAC